MLVTTDLLVSLFFQKGLEHYYGLDQEADILIVGHSHLMKTCNKNMLENELNLKVSKYCREGVLIRERYGMVKHFLDSQQDKSVPIVIYGVDPFLFTNKPISLNSHKLFYPFMDKKNIDELIRRDAQKWYDYPLHKYIRSSRYTDISMYRSCRGWMNYWESLSNGAISEKEWSRPRNWTLTMSEELLTVFHDTINLLLKHNCHVVLVYPGIIQSFREGNPEAYNTIINFYQSLADQHPNIDFLDYSEHFSPFKEMYEDSVHINRKGEQLFSRMLINDLQKIIREKNIPLMRIPKNADTAYNK